MTKEEWYQPVGALFATVYEYDVQDEEGNWYTACQDLTGIIVAPGQWLVRQDDGRWVEQTSAIFFSIERIA
jgi:hypothetical protein